MASGFTLDRHRDAGTQPGKPPAGRVVAILAWMPLKKSKKIPGVPVENIVDFFLLIGTSQPGCHCSVRRIRSLMNLEIEAWGARVQHYRSAFACASGFDDLRLLFRLLSDDRFLFYF